MNSEEILKEVKAKVTRSRLLVVNLLLESKLPISVDLIVKKTKLNKVSVYRVVDFLVEKSVVKMIELRQAKALFILNQPCVYHYVVCLKCKKIKKIKICLFKEIEAKVLRLSNFKVIKDHSLEFFGLCQKCSGNN